MANTKKENGIMPRDITIPAFYELLTKHKVVTIRGIGTIRVSKSKPYMRYDPKTEEKVKSDGRVRFLFKPTRGMRIYVKSKN